MIAKGDNLSSAIQKCGTLVVLGQGILLDGLGLFYTFKVVFGNLERLPLCILLVHTEDVR